MISEDQTNSTELYDKEEIVLNMKIKNVQANCYFSSYTLFIYPAFNGTYITHGFNSILDTAYNFGKVLGSQQIRHISNDGDIIKRLQMKFISIHMMSQKHAIIWRYSSSQQNKGQYLITQWDLQTGQIINVSYSSLQSRLFTLPDSKIICLMTTKRWLKSNLIQVEISLFKFPFVISKDKPIHVFTQILPSNIRHGPMKLDNESSIVWCSDSNEKQLTLYVYNFQQNPNKIKILVIKNNIDYNREQFLLDLVDIWCPQKGKIYLKFELFINQYGEPQNQKKKIFTQQQIQKQRYYQYIYQYKTNTLRQPKWITQSNKVQSQIQFINSLRKVSFSHKIKKNLNLIEHRYQQIQESFHHVYYVDPSSQQIMYQGFQSRQLIPQTKRSQRLKYFRLYYPEYNTKIFYTFEGTYTAWGTFQFKLRRGNVINIISPLQIMLTFFMLQLIKDCDDDLIRQVTNIAEIVQA